MTTLDTHPVAMPAAASRSPDDIAEARAGWVLAAPAMGLLFLLLLGPSLAVIVLSLTDWQLGAPSLAFIGLANYEQMFADRVFWQSFTNTIVYCLVVVPGSVLLGLVLALLIELAPAGRAFYRAAYFLPVTSTLIAMAVVWEFLLHPSVGLINLALESVGLGPFDWLKNPRLALFTLATIGIWQSLGLNMVLFMAGLKAIPADLYEAAEIDGAGGAWDRFRTVTWPMLGPTTLFVAVVSGIRCFQVFDTVEVLTKGGPNKATEVLIYTMYTEGFGFFRTGYASAITVVFVVVVLTLTLLQVRLGEKRTHYA
jgi:multiple sugar transport system permease protein